MFTGIVTSVGSVASLEGPRLVVEGSLGQEPLAEGESIAVAGVCLTTTLAGRMVFDLSEETRARTTLGSLRPGDRVNLERALRAGDRIGGHLVQGHVDGLAEVCEIGRAVESTVAVFTVPEEFADLLVDKGSVTIDGVSLTVIEPSETTFSVAIVPYTLQQTTLAYLRPGDRVNLELDMFAKLARRLLSPYRRGQGTTSC